MDKVCLIIGTRPQLIKAREFKGWHLEYIDDELIKQREDMVKKWGEPYET